MEMSEQILLSVTDDQTLFREGLCNLISKHNNLRVLFDTSSGQELLDKLQNASELPHIALIDMDMPGMNGIELNKQLQTFYPGVKVIILSVHNQPILIAQMIHAGADAYLEKNCGSLELLETIQQVYENGFYISRQVMEAIQRSSAMRQKTIKNINQINLNLTEREEQILTLICKDFGTVEIGEKLFISARTVEGHRQNLLTKTGCRNIAGLVLFAIKNGLFIIDESKFD